MDSERTHDIRISTHLAEFDLDWVVSRISGCYWSNDRNSEQIRKPFENSICFAAFNSENRQVACARVISDGVTFAYLCDVFVEQESRRLGIGHFLLRSILGDDRFKTVKWTLRTKDAHAFYQSLGFLPTYRPERYMER